MADLPPTTTDESGAEDRIPTVDSAPLTVHLIVCVVMTINPTGIRVVSMAKESILVTT